MPETPFDNCHLKLTELLQKHWILIKYVAELKVYNRAVLTLIEHIGKLFIKQCLILVICRIYKEKQPEVEHFLMLLCLVVLLYKICNILGKLIVSLDQGSQIFVVTHLLAAHLSLVNIRLYSEELLLNLAVISVQDIENAQSFHSPLGILGKVYGIHSEIKISSGHCNLCLLIFLLFDVTFLIITRLLRL